MDWLTLILTIVVGVLGLRYFFFKKLVKLEQMGLLHEKPWPIVGNLGPVLLGQCSIMDIVDRAYKLNEDAEYIGVYNMSEPVILIRTPELIKSITIKNFDHFVDHQVLINPDLDPLFGKNLAALSGDKWKEVRNILSPAFTGSKMKNMFNLMTSCGENFANCLAEKSSEVDTKEAFTRYTNDVIATCAFGISVDSMKNPKNEFYVTGREVTKIEGWKAVKIFIQTSFPKIAKLLKLRINDPSVEKFFTTIVKETIDTRDREGINRPDMLQLMMETRGHKPGDGVELTIQDMVSQAFIFFFGGFDTSSTAMCFAAYSIATNEDMQKKLQDEVDDVLKRTNGKPTYEAINEMQYLDAVINETLRLYPGGPFLDRICVKQFELPPALPGGKPLIIEPGQNLWLPVFSIHRDPKYFAEPMKFDPERFMGSRKNEVDSNIYLPFGAGPRMCIGNRFALLEVKVVLFYLISKCHLQPSSKTQVPLKLSKSSITMAAEGGFWLQIEPRKVM